MAVKVNSLSGRQNSPFPRLGLWLSVVRGGFYLRNSGAVTCSVSTRTASSSELWPASSYTGVGCPASKTCAVDTDNLYYSRRMRNIWTGAVLLPLVLASCGGSPSKPAERVDMTGRWNATGLIKVDNEVVENNTINLEAVMTDSPKRGDFYFKLPTELPSSESFTGNTVDGTLILKGADVGVVTCKGTYTQTSFSPASCVVSNLPANAPANISFSISLTRTQ